MNFPTLIAWRSLTYKNKDSNIAFMTKICFTGIVIGTFALMLTLIITNGFEKVIHEKIQGINANIIISSPGNKLDYAALRPALEKAIQSSVAGVTGSSIKQAILDHNNMQSVLFVKGIDPEHEAQVTILTDKLMLPITTKTTRPHILEKILHNNRIIIGHKTALEQNLRVGQEVTLLIPEPSGKRKLALKKQTVTIAGIFNIGLDEYDHNLVFMNLNDLNEMYDDVGVDTISLRLNSQHNVTLHERLKGLFFGDSFEQSVIKTLRKNLPEMQVNSWKELNPALVSSLKLEKYVMFFVLALITLVASMNMVALLFMQMQSKQSDMAILRAMGATSQQLRSIFLTIGMTITLSASCIGLVLAFITGYALERYPFIQLPDVYYVSYLPARIDTEIFLVVFCATLLLGLCATWFPAQRATKLNIINVLRHT